MPDIVNPTDAETSLADLQILPKQARAELQNLQEIYAPLAPQRSQIPQMEGIEIFGESIQLNGVLGGDHIIFMDFKKRYDMEERIRQAQEAGKETVRKRLQLTSRKAGILLADVSGHSITDAALAGRLHEAFSACVLYELDLYGTVTERLFETLNINFYNSTSAEKFITMIYGEVSEDGTFQFLSAAHPSPVVFSNEFNKIVDISPDRFAVFPPLGTHPPEYHVDHKRIRSNVLGYKKKYKVNEINLMGSGDIMVIFTDGLSEYFNELEEPFFAGMEELLKTVKHLSAAEIGGAIRKAVHAFGKPSDDVSYVIVKKS